MNNSNEGLTKFLTLLSLVCLLIPLSIYGLWVYIFDLAATQADRVNIFHNYFPEFLQGRWDTTILGIAFCILAIILSSIFLKLSRNLWKVVNIIMLVVSSLLLSLNIFSMM